MKPFWNEKKIEVDFDKERQGSLDEISLCFQEFREHKNLSIEEISKEIHIPISIITALENANLTQLPEPVYTRELIKKYANYLGLKGDDFASHFSIEVNNKNIHKKKNLKLDLGLSQLLLNPIFKSVLYIVLVIVSTTTLANFLKPSFVTNSLEKDSKIPIIEANKPSNTPPSNNSSPSVIPVVENKQKSPLKPEKLTLSLKVQDECWIRVVVDGKQEFEGLLKKGEQQKWVAKQQLIIRAGNAGGLLVILNDEEKPKTLGKLGQVAEVTFELPSSS
jgi:cytoskeletal protein RodZ